MGSRIVHLNEDLCNRREYKNASNTGSIRFANYFQIVCCCSYGSSLVLYVFCSVSFVSGLSFVSGPAHILCLTVASG
jgi:hypothetical protein